jgi:hypothetical protein
MNSRALFESQGHFTGTSNKTFAVRIDEGGPLAEVEYSNSLDGGKSWCAGKDDLSAGTVELGDGVQMAFDDDGGAKPLSNGDLFYVKSYAAGYYCGNNEKLSVDVQRDSTGNKQLDRSGSVYWIGSDGVDIFKCLADLKKAMQNSDQQSIQTQIGNLEKVRI